MMCCLTFCMIISKQNYVQSMLLFCFEICRSKMQSITSRCSISAICEDRFNKFFNAISFTSLKGPYINPAATVKRDSYPTTPQIPTIARIPLYILVLINHQATQYWWPWFQDITQPFTKFILPLVAAFQHMQMC